LKEAERIPVDLRALAKVECGDTITAVQSGRRTSRMRLGSSTVDIAVVIEQRPAAVVSMALGQFRVDPCFEQRAG
jgi:hypothetical protein